MLVRRLLSICCRQFLAKFSCTGASSIQNGLASFFSRSMRNSRNERCSTRTGECGEDGILKTGRSKLRLSSMTSWDIWRDFS